MRKSGFTLIEMLVVVAIIGILSSVLLTALGPAKDKAKDARIVQEVNQVRTIAETLYTEGNYDSLPDRPEDIDAHPIIGPLARDIFIQGGMLVIGKTSAPALEYIIYSKLNTEVVTGGIPATNYFCLDSTGKSAFISPEPSGITCD